MVAKKYDKKIVISGYYGMSNYGDDLFGLLSYLLYSSYYEDVKVSSKKIKTNYMIRYLNIPIITNGIDRCSRVGAISRVLQNVIASLFNDEYILAGGSNLCYNSSVIQRKIPIFTRRLNPRLKIKGIGLSYGPFNDKTEKDTYNEIIKNYSCLMLRDVASFDEASESSCENIIPSFDLAILGKEYFNASNEKNIGTIGVSLCHGISDCEVVFLAKKIIDENLNARIFTLNTHVSLGDFAYTNKLVDIFKCHGYEKFELVDSKSHTVEGIWEAIGSCEYFFSVRLHGAITAYAQNIPFILYEYQKKCTDFLDKVGQDNNLIISRSGFEKAIDSLFSLDVSPKVNPDFLLEDFKRKFNKTIEI
ncbi:polysaccharide pyruvyl transferase family protein [Vibrio cholerae]|uniref:polysaccharide pyruvyl transferase family protein n=1 Tax=Vibrio cholerae TaxID=666 RepID=UPI001A9F324B|nr:polysaccharide pyruvyl transferase family protein [Vibrio cholerae]EIA3113405.1 polysaccharide pyruvyl transferase family protein [Vibrio cholerae]MBO1392060.1 hypothetical protein [Vibrio cholerae]